MNMEGLSEATLEKFIAKGFIHEFADLFKLERFADEIKEMEGFGEKSCKNLLASAEKARNTTLPRLIYALGIQNIGVANAKMLAKQYHYDIDELKCASAEDLAAIDGIGEVIAASIAEYFESAKNQQILLNLLDEVTLEKPEENTSAQIFEGMNFVITGSVEHFANRNEVKAVIEERGGKVTGSVTSKTNYLINNDTTSNSSKNKKAKELNIPIISEEDFLKMLS
jgi:DNA ligase (NAD+)